MIIDTFPSDDVVRVIAWVDRIQWPQSEATTPIIEVLLRTGPPGLDVDHVLALPPDQVRTWLASTNEHDGFERAVVLIGLLPFLRIGDVVFQGRLIGSLQMEEFRINLTRPDDVALEAMPTVGDPRTAHANFDSKRGTLYPSEYRIPLSRYMASRLLAISTPHQLFLLPRTEILRRFYAVNSEWIRAMVEGPWDLTWERVLHGVEDRREVSGTEMHTGGIRVTLPAGRPAWLGYPAAIFSVTEFGQRCANEVHASLVIDFDRTASSPVAFVSARLPVEATAHDPVQLTVRGWTVTTGVHARVLVACIVACTPAKPLGPIYVDRPQRTDDDQENPISVSRIPPSSRLATESLLHTSMTDGNPTLGSLESRIDDPAVWAVPPVIRIPSPPKAQPRSKYLPIRRTGIGKVASAGRPGAQGGNPELGTASGSGQPHRTDFFHLVELLRQVPSVSMTVVPPPAGRGRPVHGWPCWIFRRPASVSEAHGWWTIRRENRRDGNIAIGIPRGALVLQLRSATSTGYWIEIQARPSEAYFALLLTDVRSPPLVVIEQALATIASNEGRLHSVKDELVDKLSASVHLVRHRRDDDEQRYTQDVVQRALKSCQLISGTPSA